MKDSVRIRDRWVGHGQPVFIVAEAGSNHNRDWDHTRRLIEIAAEANVDAVKFQVFTAETLYPEPGPIHEAIKAAELPLDWIPRIADYAKDCGLIFLASPFLPSGVDALEQVNVAAYKVASSETTNLPLLKYIASKGKPLLVSTGMCDLADIHEAMEVIRSEDNNEIVLLQCTSLYPTEPKHVHLKALGLLREAFQSPVGFSDHTLHFATPAAAVALGACVVEKHFTSNRQLDGPDHAYALEPEDLKLMVSIIRSTEQALGHAMKILLPEEAEVARRESVRAAKDIQAGEILTSDLVNVKRPVLGGIPPRYISAVLGNQVKSPLKEGDPITWQDI